MKQKDKEVKTVYINFFVSYTLNFSFFLSHPPALLYGYSLASYPLMFRMSFVSAPTYRIRTITFQIITLYNLETLPLRLHGNQHMGK